ADEFNLRHSLHHNLHRDSLTAPLNSNVLLVTHTVDLTNSFSKYQKRAKSNTYLDQGESDLQAAIHERLQSQLGDERYKNTGLRESLLKDQALPKNPGRIIAIAPARPRKGTLTESLPCHVTFFEPKDLMSIFSPSAVAPPNDAFSSSPDLTGILVRLANMETSMKEIKEELKEIKEELKETKAKLKETTAKLKETTAKLKETTTQLVSANAKIESLEAKLASSDAKIETLEGQVANLTTENATLKVRIGHLEDEVAGYWETVSSFSDWVTVADTPRMDKIRIREILNRAQARFARLALPSAANETSITALSLIWRRHMESLGGSEQRFDFIKSSAGLVGLSSTMSDDFLREISAHSSALRSAGDQAAHPGAVSTTSLDALVSRAETSQQTLLRELVSVAFAEE
ncbi:hypothetical protein H0H93_009074, partial [Arthromyces matolae]